MAEDKGGGGSSWGTFEILLGILLLIGLLARLQGDPIGSSPSQQTTSSTETYAINDPRNPSCGLTLYSPHSLEKIDTSIALSGEIANECNWITTPDVALYAQVIDARGRQLSSYTAVPPLSRTNNTSTQFSTMIGVTVPAEVTRGTLILIPATQTSSETRTLRIPLRF